MGWPPWFVHERRKRARARVLKEKITAGDGSPVDRGLNLLSIDHRLKA